MNEVITNALGEPRKFLRMLPDAIICKTCAPRKAKLGVIWENPVSGAMTCECSHCGNQTHMPYIPPNAMANTMGS